MTYYQTDKEFPEQIQKYGCLFFSLMDIAERQTGHYFIHRSIMEVYHDLIFRGYMNENCYVRNHEKVLKAALLILGNNQPVRYNGAWYNDFVTDRATWGIKGGTAMVLQYQTLKGNSHFVRPQYDSYKPRVRFRNLMSVRYYLIGE